MKGLQIAAAAACRAGTASGDFGGGVRRLLQALTTTMAANPLQPVRNAAHYSANAVLSALTVSLPAPCISAHRYNRARSIQTYITSVLSGNMWQYFT